MFKGQVHEEKSNKKNEKEWLEVGTEPKKMSCHGNPGVGGNPQELKPSQK